MKSLNRHATQVTKVSHQYIVASGANPNTLVDLPPLLWVVKGPRGGRYFAGIERQRAVIQVDDDFVTDQVSVIDRSLRTYYIRPGSRFARMVDAGEVPPLP